MTIDAGRARLILASRVKSDVSIRNGIGGVSRTELGSPGQMNEGVDPTAVEDHHRPKRDQTPLRMGLNGRVKGRYRGREGERE